MTSKHAWLMRWLSRFLEPNEREAVLGDLAESQQSAANAMRDLLGLVIRRQAMFWARLLVRVTMAVVIGMTICRCFADKTYDYLARPLTNALHAAGLPPRVVYTNPYDPFWIY